MWVSFPILPFLHGSYFYDLTQLLVHLFPSSVLFTMNFYLELSNSVGRCLRFINLDLGKIFNFT